MRNMFRILSVEVNNLKNLHHGVIEFDSLKDVEEGNFDFDHSDIIGIYGPNGTSKTSFINALRILKKIFTADNFTSDLANYINKLSDSMSVHTKIFYQTLNDIFLYEYGVTISKINNEAYLTNEVLTKKKFIKESNKFAKKEIVVDIDLTNSSLKDSIKTANSYNKIITNEKDSFALTMLKGIMYQAKKSLLFSEDFIKLLFGTNNFNEEVDFLQNTMAFGYHNMHIFDNQEMSSIISNGSLPFFYKKESGNTSETTKGHLSLFTDNHIEPEYLDKFRDFTKLINNVISTFIPNLKMDIKDLGPSIDPDGKTRNVITIVSIKDGFEIPLRYESDGIKKIISILSSYIDAFSNKSCFLAVDELDDGIYEYLLGSIIKVFKEEGLGQFVFTSHNLRALEVIKQDIMFSTQDENERFQKMKGINTTNNLRDVYIKQNFFNDELYSGLIDYDRIANALLCTKVEING